MDHLTFCVVGNLILFGGASCDGLSDISVYYYPSIEAVPFGARTLAVARPARNGGGRSDRSAELEPIRVMQSAQNRVNVRSQPNS